MKTFLINKKPVKIKLKETKTMKKLTYILVITATILVFTGCNKETAATSNKVEPVTYEDSSEISETIYTGNNGWNVTYDEHFFNLNELIEGKDIELIYKGKCKGTAYVELAEAKGRTAKELIEEKKAEYESTSEVYDAGKENRSGYVFYVPDIAPSTNSGNDRYTSVEVIDINDGALIITASQQMDEEMEVSDRIADIFNSIELQ